MTTLEQLIQPFVSESRPKGTSRQNSTSSVQINIQDDLLRAQKLIDYLVSGPAIASQSIGTLLVPILNLCASSSPSLRSKGYELICLLCKRNLTESTPSKDGQKSENDDENEKAGDLTSHGGGIELSVMERRKLWDALRSVGETWHPETAVTRLDALEALLGIQVGPNIYAVSQPLSSQDYESVINAGIPVNGNIQALINEKSLFPLAEPRANVEGLEDLIKEIRSWTSEAIGPLLSPEDDRYPQSSHTITSSFQSSSTPTLSASQISMGEKGGTVKEKVEATPDKENIIKQREAFVYRLDMIVDRIASDNPNVRTEAEICRTVELYSSWIDRAVRVETRARANAAPHSFSFSQNGTSYHAVGSGQTRAPRPHGRQPSVINTTPTTFTFPSSVVTPAETTVSFFNNISTSGATTSNHTHSHATRPAYEIIGPLFLSLLERCIKKTILIPSQTLSRTVSSLCGLLSLVMRPFDSAGILDPTPISRSRQGETEATEEQHRLSDTVLDVAKRSSMDTRVMKLLDLLFHDKWYAASTLQTIKQLLLPPSSVTPQGNNGQGTPQPTSSNKPGLSTSLNSPSISLGALRTLRYSIIKALHSEIARVQLNDFVASGYTMGGAPSMYVDNQLYDLSWKSGGAISSGVSGLRFEVIGKGLKEAVAMWRQVRNGMLKEMSGDGKNTPNVSLTQGSIEEAGDLVLIECCEVVKDVVSLSPKGEVGEVPRFAGQIIEELAGILSDQRSNEGASPRLKLANLVSGSTPLLIAIGEVLRLPLDTTVTNPPLPKILLTLADHLNDNDALTIINQFEAMSELSPSYPDWASNFRSLINAFYNNSRLYPKSRLAIATKLAKVYEDITDIDHEELRAEIIEDMISMWERTIVEEANDEIVTIAFEVMRKEIILSTMAEEAGLGEEVVPRKKINWEEMSHRIRCLWVKVAVAAPPYFEADRLALLQSPPPFSAGVQSPSAASTPGIDASHQRGLHSANQSLQVSSLNATSGDSSSILSASGIGETRDTTTTSTTGPSNSQANSLTISQPKAGRAILAVTFLLKTFNKLAFRSPQSLTILLSDASKRQSARAADMAIALFRDIVQLVGIDPPDKVNEIPESEPISTERLDRVRCPKARLVLLQWLLHLRADRDHRIYAVGDIDEELAPLARLIHRARRMPSPTPQSQPDRSNQSLPTGLAERRRNRAETKSALDMRAHRTMERNENNSREHTREPRGRATDALSASASRSRSRPPASPHTPYTIPRPVEILWNLPDPLKIELERHATRPSPAMATFTSIKGDEGIYWLHVDYYVHTLVSLLEYERDWEIISYILCHLPLQLSNKHFFCGPKTKIQIRRLVLAVCNAINGDRLCSNMDVLLPSELVPVDIQALLYSTLTVLISYHRIFDPEIGDYNQKAKSIKSDIVEVIFRGLARDEATNKPCLEALSLAVYELPDQVSKFTAPIIEKLSRIMSNPNMAVHILELLVIIGYTPRLYSGAFREEEYRRVFGVALQYIEHHYRPDAAKLRTADGGESYSLAQHVLNTAFFVIYIWFLAIKLEDRARYVSFITKQLLIANGKKEVIEPTTEVCFDWLARYAYSNADPKAASSFLYRSIVAPSAGSFNVDRSWDEQHRFEMDNTAGIKAWKLGNSIVTVSTMKKPPGWIRIVSRRPSGLTELICRLENWPHVSAGDFDPDLTSIPVTMLAERPTFEENDDSLDIDEDMLNSLINDIVEQTDVIQDIQKPDPISGYVWSGVAPSQRRKDVTIDPAYIALLLSAYPSGMMTRPSRFPDYDSVKEVLKTIDYTPVIDTHKVGVLYVAPGQTTEEEILANLHGSPAYTRFLAELGRVIKPSNQLEVYTGGLRPETHGGYAYAWWDDMSQIIYHVATVMPNINHCLYKKQEIGNDGVKIIWNDGGVPFKFDTIKSEFTLINVIVEPHSIGSRGAYSDNRHENEFFRVSLQTAPSLPRITPIGQFKIISAEKLSLALRHFTLLASLFCRAWSETGMDGPDSYPLQTNWQLRLRYIRNSEKKLPPKPAEDDSEQKPSGLVHREASRDFTLAY